MRPEDIDIASLVLYEDNHLLIVNKPIRILSQTDKTGDKSIIELSAAYIKAKYNKPGKVFIRAVQRLDRPVSGCMVLTRTSKATERMASIIRKREIRKSYHALVAHKPTKPKARLENYLRKNPKNNKVTVFMRPEDGAKLALLDYQLIDEKDGKYLLAINLETGRPHQIRAQLSYIGCPIIGDIKYGAEAILQDKSICLHSQEVSFIHPVKKENITVNAPYPPSPQWDGFRTHS